MPTIAVLGASGLIGQAVTSWLRREGFAVVPVARRFDAAQKAAFGGTAVESPVVDIEAAELAHLLSRHGVDIVVNCIGVLQDSRRRGSAEDVHRGFAARLVQAVSALENPCLLVHLSMPGRDEDDRTAFSVTKREAERIIAAGATPFVILRPGFVVADAAYGGSALVRALAALPFDLPAHEAARPFAATDVADIARTVAVVARRWRSGEQEDWNAVWDVMERRPSTVGDLVAAFRRRLGGPAPWLRLPSWLMRLGAAAGDTAAHLGWSPPIRSTALAEMRRGVEGDPGPWAAATGIEPVSLDEMLAARPATVQEKWFARLYLLKPLILGALAAFWIVTGLIALTVSFGKASATMAATGVRYPLAQVLTVLTSLADILIGVAITFRRTCRAGLRAGIGLSLVYIAGATFMMPALWLDPLGALVKVVPAMVLMLVALAVLDER